MDAYEDNLKTIYNFLKNENLLKYIRKISYLCQYEMYYLYFQRKDGIKIAIKYAKNDNFDKKWIKENVKKFLLKTPDTNRSHNTGNHKNVKWIIYWKNGKRHRTDGPAYTYFYENGQPNYVSYYVEGKRHRTDGPAYTSFYENGQQHSVQYYVENKLHRADGPAITTFYKNGQQSSITYYIEGKAHRTDGPAVIWFYENGQQKYVQYWVEGKQHRADGPAIIKYDENGVKIDEQYWLNGQLCSQQ